MKLNWKPRCLKAFIFFSIASAVCFELGNTIKNIIVKTPSLLDYSNPVFSIVEAKNTGGAFSILQNNATLLAVFGLVAILLAALYVYKKLDFENKIELLAFTFFTGGVLGNVVERLVYGHVFDYIKLNFIEFPVFNTFDVMISTSVILYAAFLIFGEKIFAKGRKGQDKRED